MNRVRVQITPNKDGVVAPDCITITAIDAKLGHEVVIDTCQRLALEVLPNGVPTLHLELIDPQIDLEMPKSNVDIRGSRHLVQQVTDAEAKIEDLIGKMAEFTVKHNKLLDEKKETDARAMTLEAIASERQSRIVELEAKLASASQTLTEANLDAPGLGGPTDVKHSTDPKRKR